VAILLTPRDNSKAHRVIATVFAAATFLLSIAMYFSFNAGTADMQFIEKLSWISTFNIEHRHSPGTHIPIVPKDHLDAHGADVLVTFAYEYLDDIRAKTGNRYRYLIPIPPREVA
jgi:hypothetical protein